MAIALAVSFALAPVVQGHNAGAGEALAAALGKAAAENQRVLVSWTGTEGKDSNALAELFRRDQGLSRELLYEYQVVRVDAGADPDASAVATACGVELESLRVPHLSVLDAAGKPLAQFPVAAAEAGPVLAFLRGQRATPRNAETRLGEALARAGKEQKRVFLMFGAPWCGWCHKMAASLAVAEVQAALQRDFVLLKVDVERETHGQEILARYGGAEQGLPWWLFLDEEGKVVVTSTGPEGNIGCPWREDEIATFGQILRRAARRLSSAEIEALLAALPSEAKEAAAKAARAAHAGTGA